MRLLALSLLLFTLGCEALFTDLSPEGSTPEVDVGMAMDSATMPDAGSDAVPSVDTGPGIDAGVEPDGGPAGMDAGPSTSTLLGTGTFEGRGGYPAAGSVRLEQISAGEYQVVTSEDFSSAAVPGPVVVLTPRAEIGSALNGEDRVVASLSAEQIAGAATYTFSAPLVPDDAFIFIYCEPFGVETARAQLVAP